MSYVLLAKDRFLDLNADPALFAAIIRETTDLRYSRINAFRTGSRVLFWALSRPAFLFLILRRLVAFTGRHARALWTGRKEIRKLTLIIHNFMDANDLDPERVAACSFMVATDRGFVSMCAHNAARETFIRKPLEVKTEEGVKVWNPLTGQILPVLTREAPVARAPLAALPETPSRRCPSSRAGSRRDRAGPSAVSDPLPGVAHGVAIELPVVADGVPLPAPLGGQLVLEVFERPMPEFRTARALPAVAIRGLVVRERRSGAVVRTELELIAPVARFLFGIELRDEAVAGDRADRRARGRARRPLPPGRPSRRPPPLRRPRRSQRRSRFPPGEPSARFFLFSPFFKNASGGFRRKACAAHRAHNAGRSVHAPPRRSPPPAFLLLRRRPRRSPRSRTAPSARPAGTSQEDLQRMAKVTSKDAEARAIASVAPEKVTSVMSSGVEVVNGCLAWPFDLRFASKGGVQEVMVDAGDGRILSSEYEPPAGGSAPGSSGDAAGAPPRRRKETRDLPARHASARRVAAAEEPLIRKAVDAEEDAWNRADAKAFAARFQEEGSLDGRARRRLSRPRGDRAPPVRALLRLTSRAAFSPSR